MVEAIKVQKVGAIKFQSEAKIFFTCKFIYLHMYVVCIKSPYLRQQF
jgi:hypothetical protein